MRLACVLLLCVGCSLVNSTTDLRNADADTRDGGAADAGPGDVPVADARPDSGPPSDAEPGEDAGPPPGDTGPAPCLRDDTMFRLEVVEPTHPPQLRVIATPAPTCPAVLSVALSGSEFTATVNISGARSEPFVYPGERTPLVDEFERMRRFVINERVVPFLMPVERMQVGSQDMGGAVVFQRNITMRGQAHLDIANNGDVVFDSGDPALGSASDANIFKWLRMPDILNEIPIGGFERYPGIPFDTNVHGSPVISDNGASIAYVDTTTGQIRLEHPGESWGAGSIGGGGATNYSGLDMRTFGTTTYLLFGVPSGSVFEHSIYEVAETPVITGAPIAVTGRARLFGDGGEYGYAAWAEMTGTFVPTRYGTLDTATAEVPSSCTIASIDVDSLVHVSADGKFAYRCDLGFVVDGMIHSSSGWRLIDASDDHTRLLLASNEDTDRPYVLLQYDADMMRFVEIDVNLDGRGMPTTMEVERPSVRGAALSPDGTWLTYSFVRDEEVEIYRLRVD